MRLIKGKLCLEESDKIKLNNRLVECRIDKGVFARPIEEYINTLIFDTFRIYRIFNYSNNKFEYSFISENKLLECHEEDYIFLNGLFYDKEKLEFEEKTNSSFQAIKKAFDNW